MYKALTRFFLLLFSLAMLSCGSNEKSNENPAAERPSPEESLLPKGELFIIGGGKRTEKLMNKLIAYAELAQGDSVLIITAASSEPDTSFFYACQSFGNDLNLKCIHASPKTINQYDLLKSKCIYLSGGDQGRLMDSLQTWSWKDFIEQAYFNGACIAGTSAGAAVMSEVMITGDQQKQEEYEATYAILESNNAIYDGGLGLLPKGIIIDQHFVARSRYNRAISALNDYPGSTVFGIDESSALIYKNQIYYIEGESQVLSFSSNTPFSVKEGLISNNNIQLAIFVPGDSLHLN